ncbi:MAG TPA: DUF1996 domain-containing protein [Amycolatopsis sp.]|nr:DUF1996 domain-containing protein [Amycolatopsis sp.]
MSRNEGRHRVSRRTKIATALLGAALAVGGIAVATTAGDSRNASADPVDKAFFVDITTVAPNVQPPATQRGGSAGTFTVNCGRNENGHFNPDNFIAQPGVKNGAQHLHDYVGNLTTNADSTNESLEAGGTTCKNGDKSAYYWPVLRIDRDEEESNAPESPAQTGLDADRAAGETAAQKPSVECPDVASQVGDVPDNQMQAVGDDLNAIDAAEDQADQQIGSGTPADQVLPALRDKRKGSIDKISGAVGQPVDQQQDLSSCAVEDQNSNGIDNGDENSDPDTGAPATPSGAASTTKTTTAAATTTAGSASSTTQSSSSAPASTTASQLPGADSNNELAGNDGEIQRPESVSLTFRGNPLTRVRAMPKFLRVLYGDAKPAINGTGNTKASFTCTGFENRLIDKYPICPQGSKVERIHDFPSCWDGKNIDSANHRTHIVFPDAKGKCAKGFITVPQLRVTLVYNVPRDVQLAGQYKVDSFPEEHHNPLSDHDDFANVMSQCIMMRVVKCINSGRTCRE